MAAVVTTMMVVAAGVVLAESKHPAVSVTGGTAAGIVGMTAEIGGMTAGTEAAETGERNMIGIGNEIDTADAAGAEAGALPGSLGVTPGMFSGSGLVVMLQLQQTSGAGMEMPAASWTWEAVAHQ